MPFCGRKDTGLPTPSVSAYLSLCGGLPERGTAERMDAFKCIGGNDQSFISFLQCQELQPSILEAGNSSFFSSCWPREPERGGQAPPAPALCPPGSLGTALGLGKGAWDSGTDLWGSGSRGWPRNWAAAGSRPGCVPSGCRDCTTGFAVGLGGATFRT